MEGPALSERSALVHDLFESFVLDGSTLGYLDWASGLMRLGATPDQYEAVWEDVSLYPDLAAVAFHETLHFYQIACLGYLYRFVFSLRVLITESIPPDAKRLADFPTTVKNVRFLEELLRDFERAAPEGVSVRSIVESLTYLVQKRAEFGYSVGRYDAAGKRYREHIATASVPPEYTSAFVYAAQTLGDRCDAVKMMPILAHVALCSHSPPEAFGGLCEAVARGEITLKSQVEDIIDCCRRREPRYLGFAPEVTDSLGVPLDPDPVYGSVMREVQRSEELKGAFTRFLWKPEGEVKGEFGRLGLRPVLLDPTSDSGAEGFREWPMHLATQEPLTAEEKREKMYRILLQAALSQRMIGHVSAPPRLPRG